MKQLTRENNFYYLCVALVTILFSSALARQFPGTWGEDLFTLLIVAMLLLSIKSLDPTLTWRRMVYGLMGVLLVMTVINHFHESTFFDYLTLGLLMAYFYGALRSAAAQILFVGKVDTNKIVGSVSLYLLLGLIWTMLYLALLTFDPAALSGLEFENWRQAFPRVAYYSFVTLTTLGYGDILPKSHLAQFFAYMEAVTGVFYMAIVVASLVSIGLMERPRKPSPESKNGPKDR